MPLPPMSIPIASTGSVAFAGFRRSVIVVLLPAPSRRRHVRDAPGRDLALDVHREARHLVHESIAQHGGPADALNAIADWIDVDGIARDGGAEDAYYAAQPVPGLAPNAPVLRVADLLPVKGVTAPSLAAVAPWLAALPNYTPTNVNTAPPEVLAVIVDNLGPDGLAALVASRARKPFASVADFRSRLPQGAAFAGDGTVSVRSDYFYVTVEATQGITRARARALVHRIKGEAPAIVWQVVE